MIVVEVSQKAVGYIFTFSEMSDDEWGGVVWDESYGAADNDDGDISRLYSY